MSNERVSQTVNFINLIVQYVVIPTRRSTGEAFSILVSHALGDAGSPYITGVVKISVSHLDRKVFETLDIDRYRTVSKRSLLLRHREYRHT